MYPKAISIEDLRDNFEKIENKIELACQRSGRKRSEIRLLPVTKTVEETQLRWAHQLGYSSFGENKVQEALHKWEILNDLTIRWAVIGHLQSNKIKYLAKFASEFQALDSLSIAEQLNKKLEENNRDLDVFIQINTSGESSKYGLKPDEAESFVSQLHPFPRLKIKGFMTLALLSEESARVRDCFVLLRNIRDRLSTHFPEMELNELSMGMSGDFELAIAEGATIIRIGQALFGARQYPDSHYWPK